jgi:hypothetical protein
MIAEINPGNLNGILPEEAWSWFYMDITKNDTKLQALRTYRRCCQKDDR